MARITVVQLMGIITLGWLIFANTLHNAFHYDDFPQIVNNRAIRDLFDLSSIWNCIPTRFTAYLSFALNYHFGKLSLPGFHTVNILIHIGAAIWVYQLALVTWRLLGLARSAINGRWLALFAGLIFLTHPVQTEPVNYLYQRSVLLAAFFYLGAITMYVHARVCQTEGRPPWGWYAGACVSAVLAMLSKEMSCSLPLMIVVYEWLFLTRRQPREWIMVVPFFLAVLIIPVLTIGTFKFWEIPKAAQAVNLSEVTAWQYFLTQLKVKMTYLRLLVWPVNLRIVYDYPLAKSLLDPGVLMSAAFLTALLGGAVWLRSRFKMLTLAILWFFIAIFPESGVVPINNLICEYRLYLPMAGFCIALPSVALLGPAKEKWVVAALAVLVVVYGILSFQRNQVWRDEFTLWNDAVLKSPDNQMAHLNRGVYYHSQGDMDRALEDYNAVVGLGPVNALILSNRGDVLRAKGQIDTALANFNLAIQLNPGYVGAYVNRGLLYMSQHEYDAALQDLTKAAELDPSSVDPRQIERLRNLQAP